MKKVICLAMVAACSPPAFGASVNGPSGSSIWTNGSLTPLTSPAGAQYFFPSYLNDQGHVAGNMTLTQDTSSQYGFIRKDGTTTQLPNLPGDDFSFPRALNNADQLVGYASSPAGGIHAILWQNNQVYDLNSLLPANSGWTLEEATGIDDAGQVVGEGTFNGQTSAFELTPVAAPSAAVPEPASVALLLTGTFLLATRRQKP